MKNRYSIINPNDSSLYEFEFEGYYWYSNDKAPKLVKGKLDPNSGIFTNLPFIIEGNLYAHNEKISIQIKYLDGNYHLAKIDLSDLNGEVSETISYYANIEGIAKYEMIEAWEELEDPLLEGIKVLRPCWTAFAGFIS